MGSGAATGRASMPRSGAGRPRRLPCLTDSRRALVRTTHGSAGVARSTIRRLTVRARRRCRRLPRELDQGAAGHARSHLLPRRAASTYVTRRESSYAHGHSATATLRQVPANERPSVCGSTPASPRPRLHLRWEVTPPPPIKLAERVRRREHFHVALQADFPTISRGRFRPPAT